MIYLDNSATTPLSDKAKAKIMEMTEVFGNPSSLHSVGLTAEKEITLARESVARSLSAREDEVFFTSSGTEADNIAILGGAKKNMKVGRRIITTDSEHPAVANPISFLESEGYEVVRLSTKGGRIDMSELDEALTSPVALVSVMRVNNETGAVYDIREISRRVKARSPRAIVHSDCVQAYMKERLSLSSLGADLISVSAHKVHAPKGVGALIVKKGLVLPPHTFGGGQERGLRSGTENTIGIAAFGAAVSEEMEGEHFHTLYTTALEEMGKIEGVTLNIPEKASETLLNISLAGYRSEIILHALSSEGIFVSSGSACSSKKGASPTLRAFGLDSRHADGALRVSFSRFNTVEEIKALAESLEKIMKNISKR